MDANNNQLHIEWPQGIGANVFEDIRTLIAHFPGEEWASDLVSFVVDNAVVATVLLDMTRYPRQEEHKIAVFRALMGFVDTVIMPCRDVQDPHDLKLFSETNLPMMIARMIDIDNRNSFEDDDFLPFDLDFYVISLFSSQNLKLCQDKDEATLRTAVGFHAAIYTAMNEYVRL